MDGIVKPIGWKSARRAGSGAATIRAIFDPAYYLRQYPDVAAAGIDPLTHYLDVGWAESRNPCALFDNDFYLEQNPDVAQAGVNPLLHYVGFGAREGRRPHPLFDAVWYLAENPDVAVTGENPLAHYIRAGVAEKRAPNPLFDVAWYLEHHPEANANPLFHYLEHGAKKTQPHPLFDGPWYLERYPDVAQSGMNPLAHYLLRGHLEARDPNPKFDAARYMREHPESAGKNPLVDYFQKMRLSENSITAKQNLNHRIVARGEETVAGQPGLSQAHLSPRPARASANKVRAKRIAVFAFYDRDGLIPDYTLYYLKKLKEAVDTIIFVSDCTIAEGELPKISNITHAQIIGRHEEYDFGSYKRGLKYIEEKGLLAQHDQVLLCNDSCIGPVHGNFTDVFEVMETKNVDFWGITDNDEFEYHLQSYFICLSKKVAQSRAFTDFMGSIKKEPSVREVVLKYEVKMTGILRSAGFSSAALVPQFDIAGKESIKRHLLCYPALLMDRGSPFVKVKAMKMATHNLDGIDRTLNWMASHNKELYSATIAHPEIGRFAAASDIKFSIILPTHNRKNLVLAAIDSALSQTHPNFELIIIDDASDDGTFEAIHERYNDKLGSQIIYHRAPGKIGVSRARNLGLSLASNDWIAYLDSDNVMRPNFLSVFANNIFANAGSRCFYAMFRRQSDGAILGKDFDYQKLATGNFIDLGVFVHAKDLFTELGGFDPNLKRLVDWDIILKYTRNHPPFYISRILLDYQDRQDTSRISIRESAAVANAYIRKKRFNKTIITTCILTRNHAKFIAQAIESALAQTGDFVHEILISDDASNDGTGEIISAYAKKHPMVIRDISRKENVGISNNYKRCFETASGDYIAILEGDDYWTHKGKLSAQLEFMKQHADCSMAFSKIEVHDVDRGTQRTLDRQDRLKSKLSGADFLADPSMNLIANFSSCFFRADLMKTLPEHLFKERFNEIGLAFYLEQIGPIGFIDQVMSVYRQHSHGVWTGLDRRAQLESGVKTRRLVQEIASPKYKSAIEQIINERYLKPLATT